MSEAKKRFVQFELLSVAIVEHIFKDLDVTIISQIEAHKDGGYDIVVECSDGQRMRKVYFECKLRSGNLNLRDIAANIIIAHNEGAVAMVALTNHDYTLQADEQISNFFKKTTLNIKVIIGSEIKNLVSKFNIPIPSDLEKLIYPTKSSRDKSNTILQIDFSKPDIHNQILKSSFDRYAQQMPLNFTCRKLSFATASLRNGDILSISGLMGVGKRDLAILAIKMMGGNNIAINADLHKTQERLLTGVLLDLWGISMLDFFGELGGFTDENIDSIFERLSKRNYDKKIQNILRRLLGDKRITGINDEYYNLLVCDYIVEMVNLRQDDLCRVFVFENLAYADDEIFHMILHMIRKFSQHKIPCIVIQDTEEYAPQRSIDLMEIFGNLPNYSTLEIGMFTKQEAVDFVLSKYSEIPRVISEEIVNHVGTRQSSIVMLVEYLRDTRIPFSDYKAVSEELEILQPNAVPTIMGKVMEYYRRKCDTTLFDTLFLLKGKVRSNLLEKLKVDSQILEQLVKGGILAFHQGHYSCSNRLVLSILEEWGHAASPRLHNLSFNILQFAEEARELIDDNDKVPLLLYQQKYDEALGILLLHMKQLENERQFNQLLENCDMIIDIFEKLREHLSRMEWTVYQLKIMAVKKMILTPKATFRIRELGDYLDEFSFLSPPKHFKIAYDYFRHTVDFKNGKFESDAEGGMGMKVYFEKVVEGLESDNTDDWLGHICNRYALYVKESEGYEAALDVYVRAHGALPESSRLWRGFISHQACMKLYSSPKEAFELYDILVQSSHEGASVDSLPFHEYVDKAMSALLFGDDLLAEKYSRLAADICEANGVLDEWGRSLNILGCSLMAQGKVSKAKSLFKESFQLLKVSGYKLFQWRSQLNFVYAALIEGCDGTDDIFKELNDAYLCFRDLHKAKLNLLLSDKDAKVEQLRDYHALLSFSLYYFKIKGSKYNAIQKDFELGSFQGQFECDLKELLSMPSSALPKSPYYRNGMIMMVG